MTTTKNDKTQDSNKNQTAILAIPKPIDAQAREVAESLDKDRKVYYLYSGFDSLSSSYSMFRYFFDVGVPNSTPDDLHDAMLSPTGIAAIAIESTFLITFSLLACHYDNEKEDSYKKKIADAWPYVRDVIKGLKNGYKGWRGFVIAARLLNLSDLKGLLAPVGLGLGVVAALSRYLSRDMIEARKLMMNKNKGILDKIAELPSLTAEGKKQFLSENKIAYQSLETRYLAFAYAAWGGLIDGSYSYFGVFNLVSLSPAAAVALISMCSFYTLCCIVTRIYEEYDFQLDLFITQTKCELALITTELNTAYQRLCVLKNETGLNEELVALKATVCSLISDFEQQRQKLHGQLNRSYWSAVLLGVKNSLYGYNALASSLFFTTTLLSLCNVTIAPWLLLSVVSMGTVMLVGFIAHALIVTYQQRNKQSGKLSLPKTLLEIKTALTAGEFSNVESEDFRESLQDGLTIDAAPTFFFPQWFEVIRSLFTGLVKGQKCFDFVFNPLQEADEQGHYHDTPFMYVLSMINSLIFGTVLALRALGKGLGRKPLGEFDMAAKLCSPKQSLAIVVKEEERTTSADSNVFVDEEPSIKTPDVGPTKEPAIGNQEECSATDEVPQGDADNLPSPTQEGRTPTPTPPWNGRFVSSSRRSFFAPPSPKSSPSVMPPPETAHKEEIKFTRLPAAPFFNGSMNTSVAAPPKGSKKSTPAAPLKVITTRSTPEASPKGSPQASPKLSPPPQSSPSSSTSTPFSINSSINFDGKPYYP